MTEEQNTIGFPAKFRLLRTKVRWGILTNGAKWRPYGGDKASDSRVYYEVDLPRVLQQNDPEQFKYFLILFRRDSYLPSENGQNDPECRESH
jgi:hypothetical protein